MTNTTTTVISSRSARLRRQSTSGVCSSSEAGRNGQVHSNDTSPLPEAPATSPPPSKYIIAFDFGSTNIKACCFDTRRVQLCLSTEISYEYEAEPTASGLIEINADHLLSCFHRILAACFRATAIDGVVGGTIDPDDVECIAFTGQRNTFITWHADTGRPFHQFISWKSDKLEERVRRWNANYLLRLGKWAARAVYSVSGSQRMYIMSNFYFMSKQVLPRLKWCVDRIPELRSAMNEGKARIGGIETWITWRLSRGEKFVVDKTFACGTGLFQPVLLKWSTILRFWFRIPHSMLPEVVDSCAHENLARCYVESIRGAERCWPLKAMCEDQQAAMFAALEYGLPQKITLGTGSFFNALVGSEPIYDQQAGIYPLRACCLPNTESRNWIAEASLPALGETMTWALECGLSLNAEFLPLNWRTAPYFDHKNKKFIEHENFKLSRLNKDSRRSSRAEATEAASPSNRQQFFTAKRTSTDSTANAVMLLTLNDILYGRDRGDSANSNHHHDDDIDGDEQSDDSHDGDIRTVTNAQQKAANERQHKSALTDLNGHETTTDSTEISSQNSTLNDLTRMGTPVSGSSLRRHLLAYSVIEGCTFALYENLLRIQRRIPFDDKIGVDGGITNNPLLLRSLSTLLGVPLVKCACTNGSALGVALLAFFSRERDSLADKMRDVNVKLGANNNKSFDIFGLRQLTRRTLSGARMQELQEIEQLHHFRYYSKQKSAGTSPTRYEDTAAAARKKYMPSYSYDASEEFVTYEPDVKMTVELNERFVQWTRLFRHIPPPSHSSSSLHDQRRRSSGNNSNSSSKRPSRSQYKKVDNTAAVELTESTDSVKPLISSTETATKSTLLLNSNVTSYHKLR